MLSVVWFKLFQEQFVFKGHIIPSKREVCIIQGKCCSSTKYIKTKLFYYYYYSKIALYLSSFFFLIIASLPRLPFFFYFFF